MLTDAAIAHFDQLLTWIKMEGVAEAQRVAERHRRRKDKNAERSGETILDLVILDQEPGLAGRFLVTLQKRNQNLPMPWHRLRVGSPVVLTDIDSDDAMPGVVSRKATDTIQIAVQHLVDDAVFRIDLAADEVTRQRQVAALNRVVNARGRLAELRSALLAEREPRFGKLPESLIFKSNLNPSQQSAVGFALSSEDYAIIHGPPGTGKTTTLIELIYQATQLDQSVLACAPSNTAVDNLVEQLDRIGLRVVRMGHPARVSEPLRRRSLDALVENDQSMGIVRSMYREAEQLFRQVNRYTRAKPRRGEKREIIDEAKRLRANARLLEKQAVQNVLDAADVICGTASLDDSVLGDRQFDLCVIDEACQTTEPGCWIPVCRSERVVFAGDFHQLPPTVLSKEAAREGFDRSLMQRLNEALGESVTRLLSVQYRMNDQIKTFSSNHFYAGRLESSPDVQNHLLSDLENVADDPLTNSPVEFIDTAGAEWSEELEENSLSKLNRREAELLLKKASRLHQLGLGLQEIAVIVPYAAQVRLFRSLAGPMFGFHAGLEIDTVDGFQGREKEAVLISLVRSNRTGEIGFLSESRRMNVALTRARRKLIVIGDSATVGGDPFFKSLLEYFESIGAYRTVWDETD